ncbi:MAG: hypothetical protein ACWGNV_13440 [Bacteroidales bacterium]
MKKSLFLLLVMAMSLPAMAGLKEKHVLGTWTYQADTGSETLTGTITFSNAEGILAGEVNTDMGEFIAMTKVEIRDNNILYFEVPTDYEVLKITVTMNKKTYSGTIASQQGEIPIIGEKKN